MQGNDKKNNFKEGLKCEEKQIQRDTLIVTCDLAGSFREIKGNRDIVLAEFVNGLCDVAKKTGCSKIKFSFLTSDPVIFAVQQFDVMKDVVKKNEKVLNEKNINFEFGSQYGEDGRCIIDKDNEMEFWEYGTEVRKSLQIVQIVSETPECNGILVIDDNSLEMALTSLNLDPSNIRDANYGIIKSLDKNKISDSLNCMKGKKYYITKEKKFIENHMKNGDILIARLEENENTLGSCGYISAGIKSLNERLLSEKMMNEHEH